MPKLKSISECEAGMQLSAPIFNRYGQMLLQKDTELTQKHFELFKIWGIEVIPIKEEEVSEEEEYSEEILKLAEDYFNKRINWKPRNEYEKEVFGLAFSMVCAKTKNKKLNG